LIKANFKLELVRRQCEHPPLTHQSPDFSDPQRISNLSAMNLDHMLQTAASHAHPPISKKVIIL
jgi:hypothetical protein